MPCLHPKLIPNPLFGKFISKAGIPVVGYQPKYLQVPCGRCVNCLSLRQDTWAWRIEQEALFTMKNYGAVYFITMTYDDEHLVWSDDRCTLYKDDVQKFMKKVRYYIPGVRYFLCGEYGDMFGRPHYHWIGYFKNWISRDDLKEIIYPCWNKCEDFEFKIDPFSLKTAEYVAKYSMKRFGVNYDGVVPPFAMMSLKPPIGECFLKDLRNTALLRKQNSITVYDSYGRPHMLPRCFRERVFTQYELKYIYQFQEKERDHIDAIKSGFSPDTIDFLRWRDYDYKNSLLNESRKVKEKWISNFGKDCNMDFYSYISSVVG